ncbi:hypothetical protein [Argonema galeatum]|uniref:hypothetical protein n=1 Tax=Argonema galeatum TaxID=2942762 RepID=UPI00201192CC|nr:hypothetical protein [Argonema galeatum]MCL1465029.1 hypothetical protein [Argonema galeatum A003/A1]
MASSPLDVDPVLDFEKEEERILEATARQPLVLNAIAKSQSHPLPPSGSATENCNQDPT